MRTVACCSDFAITTMSRPLEPQVLSDINWWPGKANPAKPWPFVYKAGPSADSESFRDEILDGLASVNPDCVMYIHNRQSHVDMTPFLDTYAAPCKIDDDVDLEEEWVQDLFNDYVDTGKRLTKSRPLCDWLSQQVMFIS